MKHLLLQFLTTTLFCSISFSNIKHEATFAEQNLAVQKNKNFQSLQITALSRSLDILRPVEDVAKYKYLLLNYENLYGLDKATFAQNLPQDMTLVVLSTQRSVQNVKQQFLKYLPADRLIVVGHPSAPMGFWARDAFPFPVIQKDQTAGLVAHQYYRDFDGQNAISEAVQFKMTPYDFVFVGGNLMATEFGDCFTIKGPRMFGTKLETIKNAYGCQSITALPHLSGIGDVDEVLKVLPNKNAITNQDEIAKIMTEKGYSVQMLPKLRGYRTYANSLILNGTVFMPSYNDPQTDFAAQKVYESYGYKVVPVDSRMVSDQGHGSIHCITMAYPNVDIESMLENMGYSIF